MSRQIEEVNSLLNVVPIHFFNLQEFLVCSTNFESQTNGFACLKGVDEEPMLSEVKSKIDGQTKLFFRISGVKGIIRRDRTTHLI